MKMRCITVEFDDFTYGKEYECSDDMFTEFHGMFKVYNDDGEPKYFQADADHAFHYSNYFEEVLP